MTTIAWDGRVLAADTQCSIHRMSTEKLHRLADGSLVGMAGNSGTCLRVVKALDAGEVEPFDPGEYAYLRVWPDGRAEFSTGDGAVPMQQPYFAIGSGADYAMGALAMGADAMAAVRIAALFDSHTGGRVEVEAFIQPNVAAVGHA